MEKNSLSLKKLRKQVKELEERKRLETKLKQLKSKETRFTKLRKKISSPETKNRVFLSLNRASENFGF